MVNSNRAVNPLLTPESTFSAPNPSSILASVAARRTDLLYCEFYKNLLRSVSKSQNFKQLTATEEPSKNSLGSEGALIFDEKSPKCPTFGPVSERFDHQARPNTNQLRSFYEGIYNRLTPSDHLLRLRPRGTYGFRTVLDDLSKPVAHWQNNGGFCGRNSLHHPNDFLGSPVGPKVGNFTNMAFAATNNREPSPLDMKIGSERISRDLSSTDSSNGENASGRTDRLMHLESRRNEEDLVPEKRPESRRSSPSSERIRRKRRSTTASETCPVCGVTVRDSEMKQHFASEVAKLGKLAQEVHRNSKRTVAFRKIAGSQPNRGSDSFIQATTNSKKHEDGSDQRDSTSKENRFKTFQKVRANRLDRFNSKVGQCRESLWRGSETSPLKISGILRNYGQGVICPICNASLGDMTTHDQISDHVMQCTGRENNLRLNLQNSERTDPGDVDVEADDGSFEEYEWCGQTRVRATALAHRELLANAPGFHVIRNVENEDSDQDLNVETDETFEFGGVQFTDSDLVVPRSSDEEDSSMPNGNHESCGNIPARLTPSASSTSSQGSDSVTAQSPSVVVQALRMKIRVLEGLSKDHHCLICMESYKNPLVSIQCWHVHCEKCWMRALGVKKLCPQCNMITPASHLRRIFL